MTDATFAQGHGDPYRLRGGRPHEGPASKRIVAGYGFWTFLLSDIVMFSCFFTAYAVLHGQTAGGPKGSELFDLRSVAAETAFLLLSSFACGLAMIAADLRSLRWYQVVMAVTCLFGLGFLALEFRDDRGALDILV